MTPARPLTFALCLAVLLARGWNRLLYADLWAEDARHFVTEGLRHGFSSLAITVDGSYFVLERLIALSGIKLAPLSWLPAWICALCFLSVAAIASRIASDEYAWLIPSRAARILVAVLYCCAPGLNEMLGNLANLNWSLFFWLALILLKDPAARLTRWEVIVTALVVASTGTFLLLIPLACWRVFLLLRAQGLNARRLQPDLAALLLMLLGTLWLIIHKGDRPPPPQPGVLGSILTIGVRHLIEFAAILPWAGDERTIVLAQPDSQLWFTLAGVAFIAGLAYWAFRQLRNNLAQALFLFLGGVAAWTVLACLARPGALAYFQAPLSMAVMYGRYAFPVSIAALICWMAAIHPQGLFRLRDWRSSAAAAFVLGNLYFGFHRFDTPAYGPARYWRAAAKQLESEVAQACGPKLTVRAYPNEAWVVTYAPPPCPK